MKSASHSSGVSLLDKLVYFYKLYRIRIRTNKSDSIIPWDDIREYTTIIEKYCPKGFNKLDEHRTLEIGYGARPWRLLSLASLGVDIKGIDLDRPTYGFSPKRLWEALRENGFERFLKSFVRAAIFDRADLNTLKRQLQKIDRELVIEESRMVIGNARDGNHFEPNQFSFAFSEDVFEHISSDELPSVLDNIKVWMKPGGILVIRPNVWTGICGGHDPDYYPYDVLTKQAPRDRPWEHLLNPDFAVNTYLNKLRIKDYVNLFTERFEIMEVKQKHEELGKEYLTPMLLEKLLPNYTEEELLTNQTRFVLRVNK
ncbi:MAG: methyltransferase domain-containing protein [Cytophagales bacterium]|nr:MAG: methyltransferase domain-containing protein [Cytophagales bacterium]